MEDTKTIILTLSTEEMRALYSVLRTADSENRRQWVEQGGSPELSNRTTAISEAMGAIEEQF